MRKKRKIIFTLFISISLLGILSGIFIALRSMKYQEKKISDLFSVAENLENKGKFEEAIVAYNLLVDTYPQSNLSPISLYETGKITEFYLKDFEKAKKIYFEIIKNYKNSKSAEIAKYKLEERSKFYKDLIKKYPEGNYGIEEIFKIYKNDYKNAIKELNFIIEGYNKWGEKEKFVFALGKIYKEKKEYQNSIKTFKKFILEYPRSLYFPIAYLEISDLYYKVNKFNETISALDKLEKLNPDKYLQNLINYGKGETFYQTGDYQKAIEFYKMLEEDFAIKSQRYFSCDEGMVRLADVYQGNKEYEMSIRIYKNFLAKYKGLNSLSHYRVNRVLLRLGKAEERSGDLDSALLTYSKIYLQEAKNLDKEKTSIIGLLRLGNIYFLLNKFEDAIKTYQKIVNLYPEEELTSEAIYRIGVVKESKGEIILSSYYENILKKYNSPIIISDYYHYIRVLQKEFKESTPPPSLREIEKIEENVAKVYGDKVIEKAKKELYIEENPLYHFIIGDIYYYQGDYKRAKEKFNFLLKRNPEIKIASNFANTLSQKTFDCQKYIIKISLREKIKLLEEKNVTKENSVNYLQLSELYQKLGWYPEAMDCYEKIIYLDGEILDKLYKENLEKLKENLEEISKNIYFQLDFILNTDYIENKINAFNGLKLEAEKYQIKILEILPSVYAGVKGKVKLEEDEIEENLGVRIKLQEYQKNYKFLFTRDKKLLEKQKNILNGTLYLFKILKEIRTIRDYREIKEEYLVFLKNFKGDYIE